ncbi:hypothetical protein VitviT2T_014983 [Vitis vinifera]|uniref:Uncharacterized protein n=2 Tax=Vitis vinifera TaxID=29760 RepID=A5C818_VITVI|nr:hypothetical protein VitviT2T_014983 [Vitis vinifera]CAN66467.1 hypothetical protein VITISV_016564 [Vitis vinifera]
MPLSSMVALQRRKNFAGEEKAVLRLWWEMKAQMVLGSYQNGNKGWLQVGQVQMFRSICCGYQLMQWNNAGWVVDTDELAGPIQSVE